MGKRIEAPACARRGITAAPTARHRSLIALLATVVLAACAGTPGTLNNTSVHLGRGTQREIVDVVPLTLHRFGYAVVSQRATPNTIAFETGWLERLPFEDEANAGLDVVRTRLTVEARRTGRLYSVWLRVENTAPGRNGGGAWQQIRATPMFEQHVARITRAIKDEIDAGMRVY